MNESRQHIDDLFKNGLEHYELDAPMHVWDRIDQKRTPVYKLVNNFKQNYRWYLSVVAGLAIMSSAAVMLLSDGNHGNIPVNAKSNEMAMTENHQINLNANQTDVNAVKTEATEQEASAPPENLAYDYRSAQASSTPQISQDHTSVSVQPEEVSSPEINTSSNRSNIPPTAKINDNVSNDSENNSTQNAPIANAKVASTPAQNPAIVNEVSTSTSSDLELGAAAEGLVSAAEESVKSEDSKSEEASVPEELSQKLTPPYIPSKWSIEALGSYTFVNRNLSGDANYTSLRNSTDKMLSAFTLQVRGGYQINDHFGIRTGLSFTKMNERMSFKQPYEVSEVQDKWVTGYVLDPILGPQQVQYQVKDTVSHTEYKDVVTNNNYTFIDLPLMLNYTVLKSSRMSVYVNAGAILNLKFGQAGQLIQRDMKTLIELNTAENPYKVRANVDFNFGLGLAFKPVATSPVEILFEPNVRFGTGSLLSNSFGIKQTFTSYNLFLGLRYNF